jgi:hypothetical protein
MVGQARIELATPGFSDRKTPKTATLRNPCKVRYMQERTVNNAFSLCSIRFNQFQSDSQATTAKTVTVREK